MNNFQKFSAMTIICLCFSLPVNAEQYKDEPVSYYATAGQSFYKTGQYASAIKEYRKGLRENPNDSSCKIGLINSYVSRAEYYNNTEKSPQKAMSDLKSAIFYFRYFGNTEAPQSYSQAYQSALTNLSMLEKATGADITGEGLLKSAKSARMRGEFAAAGNDYIRAIEDPINAKDANTGAGDVFKILGLPSFSVPYYEKAVMLDPDNPELRLKLARAYEDTEQFAKAAEHYNFALQNSTEKEDILNSLEKICRQRADKNPGDAEAHCNLGVIYQKRGNYEAALSEYTKAEKLNPGSLTTKSNLALLLFEQNKFKEAIAAYNEVLLIQPKNINARMQKAKALQKLGLNKKSAEEYKAALKLDTANTEAQVGIAETLGNSLSLDEILAEIASVGSSPTGDFYNQTALGFHKTGDLENAVKYYKLAMKNNPSDKSIYLNLAQIYSGKNDFATALSYAEAAKQKFPNDIQVNKFHTELKERAEGSLFAQAADLTEKGDFANALAKYNAIIPQTFDSLVGIAGVYQLMKDYPSAVSYYKKALVIKPDDKEVLTALAGMYIQTDDIANADDCLSKILLKYPADKKAGELSAYIKSKKSEEILNTAVNSYEAGKYQHALELLNKEITAGNTNYLTFYYRAMVYDALGKYKEATLDYETVVLKNPSVALAYYSAAVDYDTLNNHAKAIAYYKKFLELSKEDNDYTRYAKQRVENSTKSN